MQQKKVNIAGFEIAYYDNESAKPALLFFHGNSISSLIFQKQLEDKNLNEKYRIIAVDLPGHGNSSRAESVEEYSASTFVKVLVEFGKKLGLKEAVYVGHSLSGHLVIEASPEIEFLKGMLITGTPPLSIPPAMGIAFLPNPAVSYLFLPEMTEEQAKLAATAMLKVGSQVPDFIIEDIKKSDGKARAGIGASVATGSLKDEVQILKETKIPIAILHGSQEKLVSLPYLKSLDLTNLWKGEIQIIPDAGHSPHYENPKIFNELLEEFMKSIFS